MLQTSSIISLGSNRASVRVKTPLFSCCMSSISQTNVCISINCDLDNLRYFKGRLVDLLFYSRFLTYISSWAMKKRIDCRGFNISCITVDEKFAAILSRSNFSIISILCIFFIVFLVESVKKMAVASFPSNSIVLTLKLRKRC